MEKVLNKTVQAIVPIYTEEGCNSTCVKLLGEEVLIQKSIKRVLKDICRYYHYDLKQSNKDYGKKVNLKKTVPIPLTKDMVFIAVKTRIPIGKDDGAFSYVNIENIKHIREKQIYFKNGNSLKTLSSDKTIQKHINLAELLKEVSSQKTSLVREVQPRYLEDELSLREDLIIIYKRLQNIEKRLFH